MAGSKKTEKAPASDDGTDNKKGTVASSVELPMQRTAKGMETC